MTEQRSEAGSEGISVGELALWARELILFLLVVTLGGLARALLKALPW